MNDDRTTRRTRVVVADAHIAVATELRALLEPEFDVVSVVADGRSLVAVVGELRPEVVVSDTALPAVRQAISRRRGPTVGTEN